MIASEVGPHDSRWSFTRTIRFTLAKWTFTYLFTFVRVVLYYQYSTYLRMFQQWLVDWCRNWTLIPLKPVPYFGRNDFFQSICVDRFRHRKKNLPNKERWWIFDEFPFNMFQARKWSSLPSFASCEPFRESRCHPIYPSLFNFGTSPPLKSGFQPVSFFSSPFHCWICLHGFLAALRRQEDEKHLEPSQCLASTGFAEKIKANIQELVAFWIPGEKNVSVDRVIIWNIWIYVICIYYVYTIWIINTMSHCKCSC